MSELLLKEEGRGNVLAVQDTGCPPKMPDWIIMAIIPLWVVLEVKVRGLLKTTWK